MPRKTKLGRLSGQSTLSGALGQGTIHVEERPGTKEELIRALDEALASKSLEELKNRIAGLKETISPTEGESVELDSTGRDSQTLSMKADVLLSEPDQVLEARTMERAVYYVERLRKGVKEVKTGQLNDINLLRWKEYDEIMTDSLWILDRRDTSGAQLGWYWGNFIPQIPHQLMLRYTKSKEWVLDTFVGSGTTLIECGRLGRNGIGIELNQQVAAEAEKLAELWQTVLAPILRPLERLRQ